jgi:hypothetical protein
MDGSVERLLAVALHELACSGLAVEVVDEK